MSEPRIKADFSDFTDFVDGTTGWWVQLALEGEADVFCVCYILYTRSMLLDTRYNQITERVIGCAMRVHTVLGTGFQEVIYQRSLAVEMERENLNFARELEMPLFYKGVEVGACRVDFLVEEAVLVELKALHELTHTHYAQVINYLEAYRLELGLLINFGEPSLRFKRFVKNISRYAHPPASGAVHKIREIRKIRFNPWFRQTDSARLRPR